MKRGCHYAYALIGRIEQTYSARFSEQTKRKFLQEAGGLHGRVDYIEGRDRLFALAREHQQQAVRQAPVVKAPTNTPIEDWIQGQVQRREEYEEYVQRQGTASHRGFGIPGTRRFVADVAEAKRIVNHYQHAIK